MEYVELSDTVTNEDQRSYIKIESLRGKTPTDIHAALVEVCGELAVSRSTVSRWAVRFRHGRGSIENIEKSGRPKTATDDQSVQVVAEFLEEDRRVTCEEIAAGTGISATSVFRILTTILMKRKISARWVPHQLTVEQKEARLHNSQQLLVRYENEGNDFLHGIIAIDETWIRDYKPELKSQSSQWKSPSSPRPQKFRRAMSKVKLMMIFAYDYCGVIMTDRVPTGTTVNAQYYHNFLQNLRRKMHKNRPNALQCNIKILHDNARPHMGNLVTDLLDKYNWEVLPHAPYSPDLSPPDFDLFQKLKDPMRGIRFDSLDELSNTVTQRVRHLNKSGELTGIMDLPKRWKAVIEKNGDYIEGL